MLCLALTGCMTPARTWQERAPNVEADGGPADTSYLLRIDPSRVESPGPDALAAWAADLEQRYAEVVAVDGIVWPPLRSSAAQAVPDRHATGGDSLLFTGIALAAWSWKYMATGDSAQMIEALRGAWILTHAAGTGVLCRAAFPSRRDAEFDWPRAWEGRDPRFVGETPAGTTPDPIRGGHLEALRWYTRATRDQLTGLVLGLSVAWAATETGDAEVSARIRPVVAAIVADVVAQLRAHEWRIRDANGANDTSADDVDDVLRLAVLALAREVGMADADGEYQREFASAAKQLDLLGVFDRYSNLNQYYAHNLRAARSFAVWLLDEDPRRRQQMIDYAYSHWRRWTDHHGNTWLAWLWCAMSGTAPDDEGLRALYELRLKPIRMWSSPLAGAWGRPSFDAVILDRTAAWALPVYLRKPTGYFVWQKEPWDAGREPRDELGLGDSTGLDFLAAYWLGRSYGFIAPAP